MRPRYLVTRETLHPVLAFCAYKTLKGLMTRETLDPVLAFCPFETREGLMTRESLDPMRPGVS